MLLEIWNGGSTCTKTEIQRKRVLRLVPQVLVLVLVLVRELVAFTISTR